MLRSLRILMALALPAVTTSSAFASNRPIVASRLRPSLPVCSTCRIRSAEERPLRCLPRASAVPCPTRPGA